MKKLFTLILSVVALNWGVKACSCFQFESFCMAYDQYDLAISGVVVGHFTNGISVKVLHVLHGTESKDTIKIWDLGGPYNMCNDSLTNTTAAYLSNVGDTFIMALPRIDTIKNAWDVVGDYRTVGFECSQHRLQVTNSKITGLISGGVYCENLNNCLKSYDYDKFIVDFPTKKLACETWLTVDEPGLSSLISYFPNPVNDRVIINTSVAGTINVVNQLGQVVAVMNATAGMQGELNTKQLPSGTYMLSFSHGEAIYTGRLVVQH